MEDEDELVNSEDELAVDGSGGGKLSSKSLAFPSHSEKKKWHNNNVKSCFNTFGGGGGERATGCYSGTNTN